MRAEPAGADGTSRFAAWIAPAARSLPSSVIAAEVSPRAFRAWPVAWPSPSGPPGRQRSPALKGGVPKIVSAKRLETIFGCP
jgi:hypothetical protein